MRSGDRVPDHQIVLVVPSLSLIRAVMANLARRQASSRQQYHQPVHRYLFEPLVDAITDDAKATAGWQRQGRRPWRWFPPIWRRPIAKLRLTLRPGSRIGPCRIERRGCGEAKWGVMTHYLADWKARELGAPMTVGEME